MATTIQPPVDAALPSEGPADQPVDRSRADVVVSIAFVVALLILIVAWLLGVTPESLEARDAAPMPVVDLVSAGDPATFAELDRFLSDAFPFRSAAVRAHAQIDYGLLGGSTNPEVIVGATAGCSARSSATPSAGSRSTRRWPASMRPMPRPRRPGSSCATSCRRTSTRS